MIYQNATFANGASVSDWLQSTNRSFMGFTIPTGFVGSVLTVQVSYDNGTTAIDLYDSFGSEVQYAVAAGREVRVGSVEVPFKAPLYRLRSGTAASPSVQSAQRVVGVGLRVFE